MEKRMDVIFKIGVLLIGIALVVMCYFYSQNGRYHKIRDSQSILDTQTGIIYAFNENEASFVSVNMTNGKLKVHNGEFSDDRKVEETKAPAPPPPSGFVVDTKKPVSPLPAPAPSGQLK